MDPLPVCAVHVSDRTLRRRALQAAQHNRSVAAETHLRPATTQDVKFLEHLQRVYPNAIGFLPRMALDHYTAAGCAKIAIENGDPAGFILGSKRLRWQPLLRPIYQAAVAMDATRRHHGLALLAEIEAEARAAGQLGLQANCAAELEANEFWRAAGFIAIACLTPPNARKRDVICWRKPLATRVPLWFSQLPQRAGRHAGRSASDRQRSILNHFKTGKPHALITIPQQHAKP